jgi:hypothetical protein
MLVYQRVSEMTGMNTEKDSSVIGGRGTTSNPRFITAPLHGPNDAVPTHEERMGLPWIIQQ